MTDETTQVLDKLAELDSAVDGLAEKVERLEDKAELLRRTLESVIAGTA